MTSSAPGAAQQPDAPPLNDGRTEAARYALLRRLAPSVRHHLVVNLQPIGMIYEVMERRLRSPEPDLNEVHASAQKINGFARAALASCLDVVTWLAPEADAETGVADGVGECLGLLATSLTFRGFAVRNEVPALPGRIRRSAIRSVTTAAMIHVTDENPAPADIVLTAEAGPAALLLTLTLRSTDGEPGFTGEVPYRRLEWLDVEVLAVAESVEATREGRQRLRLAIPWVTAPKA
jgi:hypothetical protein